MNVSTTRLPGLLIVDPLAYRDARGYFFESFNESRYRAAGIELPFVQDNVSSSSRGVLRGLHLQYPHAQGKLVQVLRGEVFDVAVDVRVGSPTFGQWVGEHLSAENKRQLYIPPGMAHGFLVTSAEALVAYKCTEYYCPAAERSIRWDDPAIGIAWPSSQVILSAKDQDAVPLAGIAPDDLPRFVG